MDIEEAMAMPVPSDYRKRAEECVTLAQTVRTPEQRTMLLHIAETWLRLAEDATNSLALDGAAKRTNGHGAQA
jgi:hypothetical protein